jgi:predicted PurR-regulated permease PerM
MHINSKTLKTIGVLAGVALVIYLFLHFFWQILGVVVAVAIIAFALKRLKKQKKA